MALGDQIGELVRVPGGLPDQRVHEDAGVEADEDLAKAFVPPAKGMVPVLFTFDDLPDDLTLTVFRCV